MALPLSRWDLIISPDTLERETFPRIFDTVDAATIRGRAAEMLGYYKFCAYACAGTVGASCLTGLIERPAAAVVFGLTAAATSVAAVVNHLGAVDYALAAHRMEVSNGDCMLIVPMMDPNRPVDGSIPPDQE